MGKWLEENSARGKRQVGSGCRAIRRPHNFIRTRKEPLIAHRTAKARPCRLFATRVEIPRGGWCEVL